MTPVQTTDTTYARFSQVAGYLAANQGFVDQALLVGVRRILDLACGLGTVSRMMLEAAPEAHLNGVDADPVQVALGEEEFVKLGYEVRRGFELTEDRRGGKPVVMLAVGPAESLPFPDASFDCITIANAIHMMPDKERFVGEIRRLLRPGGKFGFNSVFYAGAMPAGTEHHFMVWVREAMAHVTRENEALAAAGLPPVKRVHGTTRRAFQNRWYSPREWSDMLVGQGFEVASLYERPVEQGEEELAAFGRYQGIAEVVMSGYPTEVASRALEATAGAALRAMGLSLLPRNWLEIWATRE